MIKLGVARKFVAILANVSLLFNSFVPFLLAVQPVYAQEAPAVEEVIVEPTPAPEAPAIVEITPTPEIIPSPEITPEVTPEIIPEITPEVTLEVTPEITPEPSPIIVIEPTAPVLDVSITPAPEIITVPENTPTPESTPTEAPVLGTVFEKVCLTDEQIKDTTNEEWIINDTTGISETKGKVQLGVKYIYPQKNKVSITFKCLPKDESLRTSLKIQKIKTADLVLPDTMGSVGEYAFDITTGMKDGDFEYDVTLPKPVDSTAEISYIEKSIDEAKSDLSFFDINKIEDSKIEQSGDTVKAVSIDHFTIFIATYADLGITLSESVYLQGDTVYINSTSLTASKFYRVDIIEQNGTTRHSSAPCTTGVTSLKGSYTLDGAAPIGTNWKAEITKYDSLTNCNAPTSKTETGIATFEVKSTTPAPVTNPTLSQVCGLDIAIVIDVSGSINNTELNQMKSAFTGFVDALNGTPTQFSVTQFDTTADILQPFTSDFTAVKTKINSAGGGDCTNWDDSIFKANGTFGGRADKPDLILFASDGNPNTIINGSGCGANESTALNAAVGKANIAKTAGRRVLTLGIGNELSVENLKAISGHNVNTGSVLTSDVITTDFSGLAAQLATFAKQTCGGKISVNKWVDGVQKSDGQTWSFKIDGTTTLTTDTNGQVASGTLSVGNHSISEVSIPSGYSFDHATCTSGVTDPTNPGVKDIAVTADSIITCNFYNTTNKGSITIIKDAVPNDPQDFSFTTTGSGLSNFSLDDNSDATLSNTKVFSNLMPGTFSVSEGAVAGWTQTSAVCSDGSPITAISLQPGENITCTFTNTKQKGHLIVQKTTIPADSASFFITASGTGTIDTTQQTISNTVDKDYEVTPGTYSVTETVPTGWSKTGDTCQNVVIGAGETKYCNITNTKLGKIIVKKVMVGGTDSFDFTGDVAGTISTNNGNLEINNALTNYDYASQESLKIGWNLTDISCDDGSSVNPSLFDLPTRSAIFRVDPGETVTCTFTNTKDATLTLVKTVVNDNGGTAVINDFQARIDGNNVPWEVAQTVSLTSHTASETTLTGYSAGNWGGDCAADGTVSLAAGENKTCTITNDDIAPTLTLIKSWTDTYNSGYTPSSWTLSAIGTGSSLVGQGSVTGNVLAGTYTLSESGPTGTNSSVWDCTGGATPTGNILTLSLGQSITCTITNTPIQPKLTVTKIVVNDNGGTKVVSDFPLYVGSLQVTSGQENGFNVGNYKISETNQPGYSSTISGACAPDGSITLALGDDKSCTITNDDIASSITLIKNVINNNGGTAGINDFGLSIDGTLVNSSQKYSIKSNIPYAINETGLVGYSFVSISGTGCPANLGDTVTLSEGQDITCTITNDDQQSYIIVDKTVVNDNGGSAKPDDFKLTVDGNAVLDEIAYAVNPGEHTVGEINLSGYTAGTWGMDCGLDGKVTVKLGETKKCTITNDDQQSYLIVNKTVINNNGGIAEPNDFKLTVDSNPVFDEVTYAVNPGSHLVGETNLLGYSAGNWGGDCNTQGNVVVGLGQSKTCTITNDDIAPSLTLNKILIKDNGSTALESAWTLTANGGPAGTLSGHGASGSTDVISGSSFKVGTYTLSESGPSGYSASAWTCTNGIIVNGNSEITLGLGQTTVCSITNNDIQPKLTVTKIVVGDSKPASSFTLKVGATTVLTGVQNGFNAGNYVVSEYDNTGANFPDYNKAITGDCASNGAITLAPGDVKSCTITNTRKTGTLRVLKNVDLNGDGDYTDAGETGATDWQWQTSWLGVPEYAHSGYTGDSAITAVTGNHFISETPKTNFHQVSISCTGDLYEFDSASGHVVGIGENANVVCTFVNARDTGTIELIKSWSGNGGQTTLKIGTVSGGSDIDSQQTGINGAIPLSTGQNNVITGTYYLSETNGLDNYTASPLSCFNDVNNNGTNDTEPVISIGANDSVSVAKDQHIICIYTNTRKTGDIKFDKVVLGGSAQDTDWTFTISGQETAKDGDTKTYDTGSYTVTESGASNYTLTGASGVCSMDPSTKVITLNVHTEGGTCTITNTRDTGSITVNKIIDIDGDLYTTNDQTSAGNWQFDVDGTGADTTDASADVTDANGTKIFSNLKTGEYTVIETKQNGYDLFSANCGLENGTFDNTDSVDSVDVYKDTNTICTFYNTPNGTIHGYKWSDMNASGGPTVGIGESLLSDWTINLYESNDDGGFESIPLKSTTTDSTQFHFGWYWFEHLLPGQYKVCEVLQNGWIQTYPLNQNDNCHVINLPDDNSNEFPSSLNYVEGHEYNFGNQQKGEVVVYKFNDLNGNGKHDKNEPYLPNWDITMDQNTTGSTQKTDETGKTIFSLIPGEYVLGENMQEGWYQSNIYCEDNGPGVLITKTGEAYGHHGNCGGWNGCGDAATCALWACEVNGYDSLVSYGEDRPCTQFNNCHLFYNRGSIDWDWGNWCGVSGVTDIKCTNRSSNPTPTPTPPGEAAFNLKDIFKVGEVLAQSSPSNRLIISAGANKTCYIGNYQKATVTVNKDVLDNLGQQIEDNNVFTTSVTGQENSNFSELSPAVYKLNPGTYTLSEINIPSAYKLKSDNDITITVTSGESKSVNFINWKVPAKLTISKTNNRWPTAQTNGSEVEYTITLNVQENNIKGVSVIDLPPFGFTYKAGSWKVLINGTERSIPEPVYHSPGKWQIGDLNKDDVVTLKYVATIDNSVDPGTYKDAAWAYGCQDSQECTLESSDKLLASAIAPGYLASTFVGTQIKIDPVFASQDVNIVKEEGQVLGATTEMPGTGAQTVWMIIFGILSLLGIGFIIYGLKKEKNIMKSLIIITLISLVSLFSVKAANAVQSSNIFISVENPISPTNKDKFTLSFTALDILNRPLTVKCFKVNPDSSEIQIGTVDVKAGGNSGECNLENNPLTESEKTYYFYAIASSGGEEYRSDSVAVDYDSSGPGTPNDYSKEREGCNYKISFKASNDGKTNIIRIYRADVTKFIADSGSQIGQVGISPDQKGSFTDVNVPDCNKTYYYVIRAFDEAGNGSGLAGDFITVYTSTTTTTTGSVLGAIPVIGDDNIPKDGSEIDQEAISDENQEGSILGTETPNPKSFSTQFQSFISRHKFSSALVALLVLFIIGYVVKKIRNKKK
ncbi:MAG: VWA domain-containing protein [Candidatus Shapirobacteria bacterium]|nr:VWA domain-containing protein [Candidatus Shapirobacteria bacterium]MDD4410805.1 VWA domain-containing protein [Candidatus Shapirobacteria bacterium]